PRPCLSNEGAKMSKHGVSAHAIQGKYRLLLKRMCLAIALASLWVAARQAGAWYAGRAYERDMNECAQRLRQLADGFRRFRHDHPGVPIERIQSRDLYPGYIAERAVLYCPTAERILSTRRLQSVSSYIWCNLHPDWTYVHRR